MDVIREKVFDDNDLDVDAMAEMADRAGAVHDHVQRDQR
jgi:hypothetical protein